MTRSHTVSNQTPSFSEKKHKPVLRTLRSALWAIGLAGVNLAPATVWADGATQTQMAKTYNIAPGPLGSALLSFADQAGVNLSLAMSVKKGVLTQGLNGIFAGGACLHRVVHGRVMVPAQLGGSAFP